MGAVSNYTSDILQNGKISNSKGMTDPNAKIIYKFLRKFSRILKKN